MGKQRGFYRSDEPLSEVPASYQRRLRAVAARHGYRLRVRGADVRFVEATTGEIGENLTCSDIEGNLAEFYSGDLMNGGGDFLRHAERV